MSEKGQSKKSVFLAPKNAEELGGLYEGDTPVLAYAFREAGGRGLGARAQSPARPTPGAAQGLLILEAGSERWMFPSQRCAWIPQKCKHDGGLVSGDVSRTAQTPCVFNASELLFAIVHRMVGWDLGQPINAAKKHLSTTLGDEIRQPDRQALRLIVPRDKRLARVADALLEDVGDDRTLDAWAQVAGMARRTFMRAFSAQQACHLAVGESRRGCCCPRECWHKRNPSPRSRSQSVTTA